jgi:cell wall-associated NlpC family hydrolase
VTAPVSGIDEIMSRIAAIQTEMSAPPAAVAAIISPATAKTAATGTSATTGSGLPTTTVASATPATQPSFENTLQQAQGSPVTQNGVTYQPQSATATGAGIVADAESYLGVPYVYAGTTRAGGMDCSGLVQTTYKDLGMSLPRISYQQQNVGVAVPSLAEAQPGDVLAFGSPAYHVAIYIGDGKMIEAPQPGENVKIANVSPPPDSIRRIVPTGITSDGSGLATTPASSFASTLSAASGTTGAATTANPVTASAAITTGSPLAAYSNIFSTDESKYGLPSGLLAAVAKIESGGNASAVSPAGAEGLMQLMPGTARSLGVDPLNPSQAVDGAARMLSGLLQKYHGSIPLTLAAYNAGPGAVDHYGGIPPYTETQNYVVKVQAAMTGASA